MARKYAARKDLNHNTIAAALRDVGYLVYDASRVGGGFPDLVCRGVDRRTGQRTTWLIEIKDGKGKLTPDETAFHLEWGDGVSIVRSVDDAYKLVGVLP